MSRDLPIGVAQRKAIELLGNEIKTDYWSDAEAYFERIGIRVRAQRVGRSSEPRVCLRDNRSGGWTTSEREDGESYYTNHKITDAQIATLKAAGWWEE